MPRLAQQSRLGARYEETEVAEAGAEAREHVNPEHLAANWHHAHQYDLAHLCGRMATPHAHDNTARMSFTTRA